MFAFIILAEPSAGADVEFLRRIDSLGELQVVSTIPTLGSHLLNHGITATKFNRAELLFEFASGEAPKLKFTVEVSPVSMLWDKQIVHSNRGGMPNEKLVATMISTQRFVRTRNLRKYPTVFSVEPACEEEWGEPQVHQVLARLLRNVITKDLLGVLYWGESFLAFKREWARAVAEQKYAFSELSTLLLASREQMEAILEQVRTSGRTAETEAVNSELLLLRLSEPLLLNAEFQRRCHHLLIDRKKRAERVIGGTRLAGSELLSMKGVEALVRSGALDQGAELALFPLLSRRFAEMLGLDFNLVLCVPFDSAEYLLQQQQIENAFNSQTNPSPRERIRLAHQEWLAHFPQSIREFVENNYFHQND